MTKREKIDRKRSAYHYRECGLDNIYLLNGVTWSKGKRGDWAHIEDVDGLHLAIGKMLISEKKRLNGRELRFLRHELNMTQDLVASLLYSDTQAVARWEKGKTKVPGPADRLIRLLYKEHVNGNKAISEPLKRLAELDELLHDQSRPVWFADGKHGWDIVSENAA